MKKSDDDSNITRYKRNSGKKENYDGSNTKKHKKKNVETVDIEKINDLIKLINSMDAYNRTVLKDTDNFTATMKKKYHMPMIRILSRIKCVKALLSANMIKQNFNEAQGMMKVLQDEAYRAQLDIHLAQDRYRF